MWRVTLPAIGLSVLTVFAAATLSATTASQAQSDVGHFTIQLAPKRASQGSDTSRPTPSATFGAVIVLATATGDRALTGRATPEMFEMEQRTDRIGEFGAFLKPEFVVPEPKTTSARASGRLSGRIRLGCISGCMATYRLAFTHLSGLPTDIVIRFGRPGESGHVWHRLCSRYRGRGNCPRSRHGTLRGTFVIAGGARDFARYDFYVEISTGRNPLGELRGQIET